jgi:A/G-specific adenine glycosylase
MQQTQVKQGLPYYEDFVNTYPTIFELANDTESNVLKLWQGLGYYSRARNLHTTAKHIANNLNGTFPKNYNELMLLKGVGDYTASAIASICYNESTAVVDGNVYRVLSRYFGIDTPINSTQGVKEFKVLATELIDSKNSGDYNQAIMEFGAKQCKPKNPDCSICPLNNSCVALKEKSVGKLPVKLKKTKVTKKYFNFLVFISSDKETLFHQRIGKGIWQNLYQFPLIETIFSLNYEDLKNQEQLKLFVNNNAFEYSLYNEKEIIHKLSHQHLYTKFWIIEIDKIIGETIPISEIRRFPTSILISNFIDEFNFD